MLTVVRGVTVEVLVCKTLEKIVDAAAVAVVCRTVDMKVVCVLVTVGTSGARLFRARRSRR